MRNCLKCVSSIIRYATLKGLGYPTPTDVGARPNFIEHNLCPNHRRLDEIKGTLNEKMSCTR